MLVRKRAKPARYVRVEIHVKFRTKALATRAEQFWFIRSKDAGMKSRDAKSATWGRELAHTLGNFELALAV